MNNETFTVFSLLRCKHLYEKFDAYKHCSLWQQHLITCYLLRLLKDMYHFQIDYVIPENTSMELLVFPNASMFPNTSIDIYAFPMTLEDQKFLNIEPIIQVLMWRVGFLVKKEEKDIFRRYYSDPFTRPVWNSLYAMVILVSFIFFIQAWWDRKIFGGCWECSVGYEMLIAIAAYFHMSLPTEVRLSSRRLSYFVFFMFAFVIHSYFTSQLLSHLVVKEEEVFGIDELINTDVELMVLEDMQWVITGIFAFSHNLSLVKSRLVNTKVVNISVGLQALKEENTALLTDYDNLYPEIKQMFDQETIRRLMEVDVFTNVHKYFFTSKDFSYTEEFKIGALKVTEAGLLDRFLTEKNLYDSPGSSTVQTKFSQIFHPFITLQFTYIFSTLIMLGERWLYKRNKVWPFVP